MAPSQHKEKLGSFLLNPLVEIQTTTDSTMQWTESIAQCDTRVWTQVKGTGAPWIRIWPLNLDPHCGAA